MIMHVQKCVYNLTEENSIVVVLKCNLNSIVISMKTNKKTILIWPYSTTRLSRVFI